MKARVGGEEAGWHMGEGGQHYLLGPLFHYSELFLHFIHTSQHSGEENYQ